MWPNPAGFDHLLTFGEAVGALPGRDRPPFAYFAELARSRLCWRSVSWVALWPDLASHGATSARVCGDTRLLRSVWRSTGRAS